MKAIKFENGDVFPALGLGTWLSKKNEVYDAVLAAIKAGYRHIDCAYIYGNEKEIGAALHEAFKLGLVKRQDLFITSKLWNSDHAPERVELAIRKSLADLQLDYLDLYLIHWPVAFKTGHDQVKSSDDLFTRAEMPLSTTWTAMEQLKKAGLARHIGVSNFDIPKLTRLMNDGELKPEVNQVELHPYLQQADLLAFCQENGVLLTAYAPLGSRNLMQSEAGLTREKLIVDIAAKHVCTPAQVLLAWNMERDVVVIPKSVNEGRIAENFGSLNVKLDADDMAQISTLERNLRITTGAFFILPGGDYTLENMWEK
jgi:alcohol dehydrogenase (NADP+)